MDREGLVEKVAIAMAEMSGIIEWPRMNEWAKGVWCQRARAALAVAEPVVREWAALPLEQAADRLEPPGAKRVNMVDRHTAAILRTHAHNIRTGGTP